MSVRSNRTVLGYRGADRGLPAALSGWPAGATAIAIHVPTTGRPPSGTKNGSRPGGCHCALAAPVAAVWPSAPWGAVGCGIAVGPRFLPRLPPAPAPGGRGRQRSHYRRADCRHWHGGPVTTARHAAADQHLPDCGSLTQLGRADQPQPRRRGGVEVWRPPIPVPGTAAAAGRGCRAGGAAWPGGFSSPGPAQFPERRGELRRLGRVHHPGQAAAVEQQRPVRAGRHDWVVGDHDGGLAEVVTAPRSRPRISPRSQVEAAVGSSPKTRGLGDQRPGDGHPLLLAAGELSGSRRAGRPGRPARSGSIRAFRRRRPAGAEGDVLSDRQGGRG